MEVVMMHTHVDDRVAAETSAEDRFDRIRRILQALEAGDEPRFNFYNHEHPQGLSNTP
jgi:hypothetical protein